jgi:hypothetical protein
MKKLAILFVALILGANTYAQDNAVTKYFSKYQSDTSFTKVSVTSKMFSLFTELDVEEEAEKEVLDAISKLKGIKALINDNPADAAAMYKDAVSRVSENSDYEELMSVEDAEENVMFMIRDNKNIINELFMIVGGNKRFMVMSLFGEIDLKQIGKLSKVMNMKGLDHLKSLNTDGDDD